MTATLRLAEELIARPSVTPDDAGCLDIIAARLQTLGFNYGRGRLSMIETQKRPAPAPLLAALRLIYGCTYAELFDGVEDGFADLLGKP